MLLNEMGSEWVRDCSHLKLAPFLPAQRGPKLLVIQIGLLTQCHLKIKFNQKFERSASERPYQLFHLWLNRRHNLHSTAPSTDDSDSLADEIISFVIICRMHELARKALQTGNIWPLPAVQDTSSVDEELSGVVNKFVGVQVSNSEPPDAMIVIPFCTLDLVSQFDILFDEIAFIGNFFQVAPYFGGVGVVMRPQLNLPRELVVYGGNITSTSGISSRVSAFSLLQFQRE